MNEYDYEVYEEDIEEEEESLLSIAIGWGGIFLGGWIWMILLNALI